MYNINPQNIHKTKSAIYVCKKLQSIIDEDENEITQYDEPIKYYFNVQPYKIKAYTEEYGRDINADYRIVITQKTKYLNVFTEFDKVYFKKEPLEDEEYGESANYYITSVKTQNTIIELLIKKIVEQ